MKVIFNDQIIDRNDVKLDMEDRGYQFGDGLYEVIRVYDGYLYMEDEHLDRLWAGADKIRMTLPFTREELKQLFRELMEAEGVKNGKLYFQVTRGVDSPRSHVFPDPARVPGVLTGNILPVERPVENQKNGITTGLVDDMRWLHCDIKSISLMGNLMSLDASKIQGYDDSILVRDNVITEASAANFFMVKDGALYTHPDGNLILPGITKSKVIQLAEELEIEVKQEHFYVEDLAFADEAFTTGTVTEITPVIAINGEPVGEGARGPITKKLQDAYIAAVEEAVKG